MAFSYSGSMETLLQAIVAEFGPGLEPAVSSSGEKERLSYYTQDLILEVMRDYRTYFTANWAKDRFKGVS